MTRFREYSLLCLAVALVSAATISFSTAGSQPGKVKYDRDGDGLIEIEFLEQLDAIRFDLDGDGKADHDSGAEPYAAAFPTSATETDMPSATCTSTGPPMILKTMPRPAFSAVLLRTPSSASWA